MTRNSLSALFERRLLLMVVASALGGCVGDGPAAVSDDAGPGDTFTIGTDIDAELCDVDDDCPLDFRCVAGACAAIDDDLDNDGYDASVDCDDNDPARHPGRAEECNEIDEDCDGAIDEGVRNACGACGPVPVEICDLLDNDCDGHIDEDCVGGDVDEVEPNGGSSFCQPVALPPTLDDEIVLVGAFSPAGDVDSFCFQAAAGTVLEIDLDSQVLGAPTDGVLALFGPDGAPLPDGYNDYADGPDPLLTYSFEEDVSVRLDAYHFYSDEGSTEFTYELHLRALDMVTCEDLDGDGLSQCDGDCNDADALVFPGQTETCDGYDNNCDGDTDEGCPGLVQSESEPNDDMVDCPLLTLPFVVDGLIDPKKDKDVYCFFVPDGADVQFDIDAQEPPFDSLLNSRLRLLESPGDVIVTNNDGMDPESGYQEDDSDSALDFLFSRPGIYAIEVSDESTLAGGSRLTYRLTASPLFSPACTDADVDGVSTCEGDCDDSDPDVHFGRAEICDGKDNNCDGVGDPGVCTGDFDGDGYSGVDGDCDDGDSLRSPAADEVCDGYDNDCDGHVDEGVLNACGGCGHPPAEVCGDGIDNDCDGVVDTDCSTDEDGDMVTPDEGDCDDTRADVGPSAPEVCDGVDNNCDGHVDEYVKNACGLCADEPVELCDGLDNNCNGVADDGALNACGVCGPTPLEVCDGADNDCDGDIDEGVANACGGCGPIPLEACDGVDNDCNGQTDEGCANDGDGDGQTPAEGDCDDDQSTTLWGAAEVCGDGIDNNCNGTIDDGCAPAQETEPNDAIADCDVLLWPSTRAGTILTAGDDDRFCVEITVPGTVLGFDVDARDDGSPLDSVLTLFDDSGGQLASNNNNVDPETGLSTVDSYISHTFEAVGTYVISVSAFGTGGSAGAGSTYELEVRTEGGCLDLDRDHITTCDGDCDDLDSRTHPGAREVCSDGISQNCSPTADDECVGDCLDDLQEQNDTLASALPTAPGSYPELQLCGGDPDFYLVDLGPQETVRADLVFSHAEGDLQLQILNPAGAVVASSQTSSNNESAQYTSTAGGNHRIYVYGDGLLDEASYELIVTVTN